MVNILTFLKKYWLSLFIISAALATSAISVYAFTAQAAYDTTMQQREQRRQSAQLDIAIKKKEQQRIAAEKLAAEQQAAAEAAEASANSTSPTDVTPTQALNCNTSKTHSDPTQLDVIVNKKHCMRPINYVPSDLVTVYGAVLAATAAAQFEAMYVAATNAGAPLRVTSSFRSYDNQVATYAHWVAVNGRAGADTVSARPGYSEHQTGLVLDLAAGSCSLECFGTTPQYAWMQTNAALYGFIERYPAGLTGITGYSPEVWHYRYVGVATATDMKTRGVATLEQYWGVEGGDYAS